MIVYHGSTLCVDSPLVGVCRDNLDFGKGFYVTDIQKQAATWANRVAAINKNEPYLNSYELDIDIVRHRFQILKFETYNREWLDFILANRSGKQLCGKYDMIEGGIANDRVFNTIELYFTGLISKGEALKRLSFEKPNRQFCLCSQKLIDECLHFTGAVKLK